MALTLLRHGEPEIATGTCYGQSDVTTRPLDNGRLSALMNALPGSFARIDSSPLIRCTALAERLAVYFDLPVHADPRLMEIDFGNWEMLPWDAISRSEIDAWAQDVEGARPHGGESVAQMIERVRAYLRDAADFGGDILAVTHLGVVRCVAAALGRPNPFEMELGFGQSLTIEPKEVV